MSNHAIESRVWNWFLALLPLLIVMAGFAPEVAWADIDRAAESDVPWIEMAKRVRDSMCGPVARYAVIIALVVSGLLVAFGELSGLFGTMLRVIMGASLALMAGQFANLFGLGGGANCGV